MTVSPEKIAEMPRLDASELWEMLFGITKDAVPDGMTDELLGELAARIETVFIEPLRQLSGITEETSSDLVKRLSEAVLQHGSSFVIRDNTPEDELFQQFEAAGWVEGYDSMFDNEYYHLTDAGKLAALSDPTTIERLTAERDEARADRDSHQRQAIRNLEDADSYKASMKQYFERANAAESLNARQAEALKPFAKLGGIILAEAPADAKTIVAFTSASGEKFALQLDYFRAARALATESSK